MEVAWCCDDCRCLLCMEAAVCVCGGLQLPVTSQVEEYKVAKVGLQSMLSYSKDAVIWENAPFLIYLLFSSFLCLLLFLRFYSYLTLLFFSLEFFLSIDCFFFCFQTLIIPMIMSILILLINKKKSEMQLKSNKSSPAISIQFAKQIQTLHFKMKI